VSAHELKRILKKHGDCFVLRVSPMKQVNLSALTVQYSANKWRKNDVFIVPQLWYNEEEIENPLNMGGVLWEDQYRQKN